LPIVAPTHPLLLAWQSFYIVVGSSSAALIGLQFVVITLISGMRRRTGAGALGAFGTPTVVHFTVVLLVSANLSAPWSALGPAAVIVGLCGLGGFAYVVVGFGRARRQSEYKPVWEDWLWFTVLPCGLYFALALGSLFLGATRASALFVVAAATLALLLVGIHNSWDTVTHLVIRGSHGGAARFD
jgi:hypothetical protein